VTHPRIYKRPTPVALAVEAFTEWQRSPQCALLSEAEGYWERLGHLLAAGRIVGPKVHDARVAALCLVHGVRELWSADRDFSSFPELATRNPLVG
jgi:predicted nucleic acid-binding protein